MYLKHGTDPTPKQIQPNPNISRYRQLAGLDSAEATEDKQAEAGSCSPKTQVAFAKTHKTGSSTLQNIFFRY